MFSKSSILIGTLIALLSALAYSYLSINSNLNPNRTPQPPPMIRTMATAAVNVSSAAGAGAPASRAFLSRTVAKKVLAVETPEGDGAVVRRSIGTSALRNISPFLMLDNFKVAEGAGFPDHPHRGQATVTYMLDGQFQHEDFAGHAGLIGPGDLQWMIAGRGIMHAEMPVHRDANGKKLPDPIGLQLWVDLPKGAKMDPPTYQEYKAEDVKTAVPRKDEPVETEGQGWLIKVIAGKSHGIESPVRSPENGGVWYFDIRLDAGGKVFQEVPTGWTSFLYTLSGTISVGGDQQTGPPSSHESFHTLVLSNKAQVDDPNTDPASVPQENGVWVENVGEEEARFVLIAGQPLDQEVYQYGPFVLASRADVQQTLIDYQMGINGFERAHGWRSKIGGRM